MQSPESIESIRALVASVAHHIDAKEWAPLRALYSDRVRTDYTSLFGGTPQEQDAQTLVDGWRGVLATVVTQHLLGPIVVSVQGTRATARCHVRALHFSPAAKSGDTWEVLGHYVFQLKSEDGGWKIDAMTLETLHQTGNGKMLAELTGG